MTDPAASDPEDYVKSPCVRVCRLDAKTKVCEGCLRTLDEIARWGSLMPDAKREILADLPRRQRKPRLFGF